MNNSIICFRGYYFFLSNFYRKSFLWNYRRWKTAEHAFQAAKALSDEDRELIRKSKHPMEARRLGQRVHIRPDWDLVKLNVLKSILEAKFSDPNLKRRLLKTGDKYIGEENFSDSYYGLVDGQGKNHLGKILMQLRDEFRQGVS